MISYIINVIKITWRLLQFADVLKLSVVITFFTSLLCRHWLVSCVWASSYIVDDLVFSSFPNLVTDDDSFSSTIYRVEQINDFLMTKYLSLESKISDQYPDEVSSEQKKTLFTDVVNFKWSKQRVRSKRRFVLCECGVWCKHTMHINIEEFTRLFRHCVHE